MMLVGTTALALSLLTGAPEQTPAQPQTRLEAPRTDHQLTGRLLFGVPFRGARFKIEGDLEKKVPFHLSLPLGDLIQLDIIYFPAPAPKDVLTIW